MADEDLRRAEVAARRSDLMLAVTTKLSVSPIAGVVPLAKEAGATSSSSPASSARRGEPETAPRPR